MATTGIIAPFPFYISSGSTNNEAVLQHDGVDFNIENDTGKTLFTNKTATHMALDHDLKMTGLYTETPSYPFHMVTTGVNAVAVFERSGAAIGFLSGASLAVNLGTINNFPVNVMTNSVTKVTIDTAGNIRAPAAYTTTIGGTNTDLYIDNTGLIGPLPSSEIFKENIRTLTTEDTDWIFSLPIKICDYLDGTTDIITIMAEEAAAINPALARYALYDNESGEMVDRADYSNVPGLVKSLEMGIATNVELIKNSDGEMISKTVKKTPITVNRSDLIYPILAELQKLNLEIEILKT